MDSETYGIETSGVQSAQDELSTCYNNLTNWHNEMWALKDQVIADWFGGGAEQFEESYRALSTKMEALVSVAKQYEQFAADNIEGWTSVDQLDQSAMMF